MLYIRMISFWLLNNVVVVSILGDTLFFYASLIDKLLAKDPLTNVR